MASGHVPPKAPATGNLALPADRSRWAIDFILLGAIWGASFLFTRLGVVEFGAVPTAGVRVAIATGFLLPLMLLRGHGPTLARHWRKTMLTCALVIICGTALSTGLIAIKRQLPA